MQAQRAVCDLDLRALRATARRSPTPPTGRQEAFQADGRSKIDLVAGRSLPQARACIEQVARSMAG